MYLSRSAHRPIKIDVFDYTCLKPELPPFPSTRTICHPQNNPRLASPRLADFPANRCIGYMNEPLVLQGQPLVIVQLLSKSDIAIGGFVVCVCWTAESLKGAPFSLEASPEGAKAKARAVPFSHFSHHASRSSTICRLPQ